VSTPNVELAHEAIGAMNRRDLDWLIAHSDPGPTRRRWAGF
jgi:hypothetical protein